jgi:hypothetical protein
LSRKLKISNISPNFVVFWKYYVKNCNENVNKDEKNNIHFAEYSEKWMVTKLIVQSEDIWRYILYWLSICSISIDDSFKQKYEILR